MQEERELRRSSPQAAAEQRASQWPAVDSCSAESAVLQCCSGAAEGVCGGLACFEKCGAARPVPPQRANKKASLSLLAPASCAWLSARPLFPPRSSESIAAAPPHQPPSSPRLLPPCFHCARPSRPSRPKYLCCLELSFLEPPNRACARRTEVCRPPPAALPTGSSVSSGPLAAVLPPAAGHSDPVAARCPPTAHIGPILLRQDLRRPFRTLPRDRPAPDMRLRQTMARHFGDTVRTTGPFSAPPTHDTMFRGGVSASAELGGTAVLGGWVVVAVSSTVD